MAEKLSDAERQNITTNDTEAAHIIPFSLAVFTERELNSVRLEPLLGVLYSEPSLASVTFPLMTSMILVMY